MPVFLIGNATRPKEEAPAIVPAKVEKTAINPPPQPAPTPVPSVAGEESYKIIRLREMAAMWKGTVLEERTVPLLAMLLVENGALAESVRGDHGFAIGLDQTHICIRGFAPLGKKYCGSGAEKRLAADLKGTEWDGWLSDWRLQFKYYTQHVMDMTNDGESVDGIIRSWNSLEVGRRAKVRNRENLVRAALENV